jgi:hypothetical protein
VASLERDSLAVFYYLRAYEISVFELFFFVVPDNMIDTRMITLFVIPSLSKFSLKVIILLHV